MSKIIQVHSRRDLRKLAENPFENDTAVISIKDSDAPPVELNNQPKCFLQMEFDDVYAVPFHEADDDFFFVNFSERLAREITDFIMENKDDVDTIICQCEMGQSRSAAVAAVLSEVFNGDGIKYFADNRYSPNLFVFRILYQEMQERGLLQDE